MVVLLGSLLTPTGEILADVWPWLLAGIATIAGLWVLRFLLLLWRGRSPRVQISTFAWASADGTSDEATWVTSLFREQLAALRLDGLDPLPDRAPGAPLVQMVEGVGQGIGRDLGAAIGRLIKAAAPDSAYEVWATLRPHPKGGGRISVQLIERRHGNRTLLNVALEQATWEEGAHEAAMAVAGALYPRVKRSQRGPWAMWKSNVPRELLAHYHDGRRFEEENCLEPALDAYHAALALDPLNPNLRLKIAMIQERLELYLDAWVTYEAIVDESDRRAWKGPDRRVYLLSLYRLAVLLGNGRVAEQWVKRCAAKGDKRTKRDVERQGRRDELVMSLRSHPLFAAKHQPKILPEQLPAPVRRVAPRVAWLYIKRRSARSLLAILRSIHDEDDEPVKALNVFIHAQEGKRHAEKIEALLQILSLQRLEDLEAALRLRPPLPRRGRIWRLRSWWIRRPRPRQLPVRREFSRSVVRTSKLVVRVRTAASLEGQVKRRWKTNEDTHGEWIRGIRRAHRSLTKRWPFPAANRWRRALHFLAPRRRWANGRDDAWQLHYNAACTAASLLRPDSVLRNAEAEAKESEEFSEELYALPTHITEEKIVERAITQLEDYAFRAGSNRVAAQADWTAIDDPDMSGLRHDDAFELWVSHHLPRKVPRGEPASRRSDVNRYLVRLLRDGALLFAATWRERASLDSPPAAEVVEWWQVENEVWTELELVCRNHLSWEERLRWLTTLRGWLTNTERNDEIDFSHERRGTSADNSISEELFEELRTLASDAVTGNGQPPLPASEGSVLGWIGKRTVHVSDAHAAGEERADRRGALRARVEHDEALRAATVWRRLAEALDLELRSPAEPPENVPTDSAAAKQGSDEAMRTTVRGKMDQIREQLSIAANGSRPATRWVPALNRRSAGRSPSGG